MTDARRILIVDDEHDLRMIVAMNLRLMGVETGEASEGATALEMFQNEEWDGCVLDLTMPSVDGFAVLEKLRDDGRLDRIAVVVLSADGAPETAIRAMELGAHAHVSKPFSPAAVAQTVLEICELSPEERVTRREEMIERASDLVRLGVRKV